MESVYKDDLDRIKYSFSALHGYEECPYQFYLQRIEEQKGINNAYAQSGSYGHDLFCRIFSKEISPQEALDRCIEEFEDQVTEYMSGDTLQKKKAALCEYLANLDIDEFFETYDVLGVEKKFKWKIDNINMIGFADLILRRKSDYKVILVDHKSSSHFMQTDGKTPLKSKINDLTTYTKQMYLYADAMRKTMGITPDLIVWNHFLDNGKKSVIEFDESELDKAIEWAKDVVGRIYSDEKFGAKKTYMMCNVLCNFREMCEYKNEE